MKKMFTLLLVVGLCFVVVACSGNYSNYPGYEQPVVQNDGQNIADDNDNNNVSSTECNHFFSDATCTAAAKCTKCGETMGSEKGHTFSDATCTAPSTCTACGVTEGSEKGHSFNPATCQAPKTCTVCGLTEGENAAHADGGSGKCSMCGIDIFMETLKQGIKAYLIIPSVGASNNHYVQVKFVNNSGYDMVLSMHVYANGKGCSNSQASNYTLPSGYQVPVTFTRINSTKDMYLDNNSQAWTIVTVNGERIYMKFDVNGNTIFGRKPSEIGEY